MEIGPNEFSQYCRTVAAELEERLRRMQVIVDYKLRSGTAYAEIMRSFLSEHAAGKYNIAEGFVVNPFLPGHSSNHCDILVYDQIQYPLLDVEGDVKVVLPRAASMVIEIEPYLSEERLSRAFENIGAARRVYPYLVGVIFGFNGIEPDLMVEFMRAEAEKWHSASAPLALFNMEKGFIAHRSKMSLQLGGGESAYELHELKGASSSAALEFLLLIFFDLQMSGMLMDGALDRAWKRLLAAGKADFLGGITLPR
jgi:hypothetical protein